MVFHFLGSVLKLFLGSAISQIINLLFFCIYSDYFSVFVFCGQKNWEETHHTKMLVVLPSVPLPFPPL
jgi:hypothetical protein